MKTEPGAPPLPRLAKSLGDEPSERVPITSAIGAIDAILRQPRRVMFQLRQSEAPKLITLMLLVTVVCSLIYGVMVGTFSGGEQMWGPPRSAWA
jgi:hypothetical protein